MSLFDENELDKLLETGPQREDVKLPHVKMEVKTFLRQTTTLYGESSTGKSTIIYNILHILRPYVPIFIVISPTAASNGDYDNRIPSTLIFSKATKEILQAIYSRQEAATKTFNRANRLTALGSLYKRIADPKTTSIKRKILKQWDEVLGKLKQKYKNNLGLMEGEKEDVERLYKDALRQVYRGAIRKQKAYLERQMGLTMDEKLCLKYFDFNPNLCLIMDDCAAEIKKWGKDESIEKMFFQGRHNYITSIYTFQHDKLLSPELRQNAFTTVFTSAKSARSYIERKTNNFSKGEIKEAMKYVDSHYRGDGDHRKIVYVRQHKKPFYYVKAQLYPRFKVCFPYIWKYLDEIKVDGDFIDRDNPFTGRFMIK